MLTLIECKNLLAQDTSSLLTDDEILVARDALYALAELAIDERSRINNFVSPAGFGLKDVGSSPSKTNESNGHALIHTTL